MQIHELLPNFSAQLAASLPPGYDFPYEAHHAHVAANEFVVAERFAIVEAQYDNAFQDKGNKLVRNHKCDLWSPATTLDPQVYVEVKIGLVHDALTRRFGEGNYTIQRGVESWADDVWRLLVGPAGHTRCGFLLFVEYNGHTDWLGDITVPGALAAVVGADADAIWNQIYALRGAASTVAAITGLADIVAGQLGGAVTRVGGPIPIGAWMAAPWLFEWEQTERATTAYAVEEAV